MPSLTIDLSEEEHRHLAESAAREGRTTEELARMRLLPGHDPDVQALADFLAPRIREAKEGRHAPADFDRIKNSGRTRLIAKDG